MERTNVVFARFSGAVLLAAALALTACGDDDASRGGGTGADGGVEDLGSDDVGVDFSVADAAGEDAAADGADATGEADAPVGEDEGVVVEPYPGGSCDAATVCPEGGSGAAVCRVEWPGGYCLVEACSEHGHDCPGDPGQSTTGAGSKCVLAPEATCLALCETEDDCRDDYVCEGRPDAAGHGSANVCVPRS